MWKFLLRILFIIYSTRLWNTERIWNDKSKTNSDIRLWVNRLQLMVCFLKWNRIRSGNVVTQRPMACSIQFSSLRILALAFMSNCENKRPTLSRCRFLESSTFLFVVGEPTYFCYPAIYEQYLFRTWCTNVLVSRTPPPTFTPLLSRGEVENVHCKMRCGPQHTGCCIGSSVQVFP